MVHLNDIFRDSQSQPGAAHFPGARLIHPEKPLEYMFQRILRYPDTGIRHLDVEIFVICIQGHADHA